MVLAGLLACTTTSAQALAPTLDELANATYSGLDQRLGAITLHAGRWAGEPAVAGAASRPMVELAGDLRVLGDLDGDGQPEAVAILAYSTGGYRVQIRSLRIDAQKIIVGAVRAGAQDPACCGGELVEWQWAPGKDKLTAAAATATGRLSLDTLSGTEWVLQAWTIGEPVESLPPVTLKFDSNHFTGASGCNRYAVGVQGTATPGEISVGLIAGTRMACPEHESAVEARFLEQLSGAQKFGFLLGRLAITYVRADGALGTMLFEQTAIAPDALGGAKY